MKTIITTKSVNNKSLQKFRISNHLKVMLTLFCLFNLSGFSLNAQVDQSEKVYDKVELHPSFIGGNEKLYDFLMNNIQYQNIATKGIKGIVYVQFIVGSDGAISNPKVIRSSHIALNNEALRVVNLMPHWIPGKQDGETVNSRFTLPIHFKIING